MTPRVINFLSVVLYFAVICIILAKCYTKPSYNWDMLAYGAIILGGDNTEREAVHAKIYGIAKQQIPEAPFRMLVDTTHQLRKEVLRSSEKFHQFLSYFRVKPLYTGLAGFLYELGVPLTRATILPSLLSFLLLSILLFFRFAGKFPYWIAGILGLSILCSPPVIEAARLSTPDALSTLILMAAFIMYLNRTPWYWIAGFAALSVLARLDNVIIASSLMVSLLFLPARNETRNVRPVVVVVVLAVFLAYTIFILKQAEYDHGFQVFYGGLLKKLNPVVLAGEAIAGLNTLQTSYIGIVGVGFVALFWRQGISFRNMDIAQYLFVVVFLAFLVRYILFPDLSTRLFLSFYILAWIFIAEALEGRLKS